MAIPTGAETRERAEREAALLAANIALGVEGRDAGVEKVVVGALALGWAHGFELGFLAGIDHADDLLKAALAGGAS